MAYKLQVIRDEADGKNGIMHPESEGFKRLPCSYQCGSPTKWVKSSNKRFQTLIYWTQLDENFQTCHEPACDGCLHMRPRKKKTKLIPWPCLMENLIQKQF